MEGRIYKDHYVYAYASALHTISPLLKEIYCDSHRREPWAIYGSEKKYGHYIFQNVLYIPVHERQKLLDDIQQLIKTRLDFVEDIIHRYTDCGQKLMRGIVRVKSGDHSRKSVKRLIDGTSRFLSCGVFKEVFEYKDALKCLEHFMPVETLFDQVLALYQPLCFPHYLKYEVHLLYFSYLYALDKNDCWIHRCIDRSAYLTRFFVEDTPYDNPENMYRGIKKVIEKHDNSPENIINRRKLLLNSHQEAVKQTYKAERDILQLMDEFGNYSLRSKLTVKNILRFIQFIATTEELKHIFTVKTAKIIKPILLKRNLDIGTTTIADLLSIL
jgi:hypothetical protein